MPSLQVFLLSFAPFRLGVSPLPLKPLQSSRRAERGSVGWQESAAEGADERREPGGFHPARAWYTQSVRGMTPGGSQSSGPGSPSFPALGASPLRLSSHPIMSDKLTFQHYVVAFLDLVGQRDALRRLLRIPATPAEEQEFIEAARESLGRVLELRQDFATYFDAEKRAHLDPTNLPPALRDVFRAATQTKCTVSGLSDAVVIAVPLGGDDEHCTAMNSVELTILSICGLAAGAFGVGLVFRGGLDVGIATSIEPNEVYGPALARAYQLESEVAEYPRFVVGDELLEFLESVKSRDPKTKLGEMAKHVAASCRRMIVQDTDGRQMLDFLGTEVRTALGLNQANPSR